MGGACDACSMCLKGAGAPPFKATLEEGATELQDAVGDDLRVGFRSPVLDLFRNNTMFYVSQLVCMQELKYAYSWMNHNREAYQKVPKDEFCCIMPLCLF